jgi:hypothetical protein
MRLPGQLFENKYMSEMEIIAKGKKDKFAMHGIHTILDMKLTTRALASSKAAMLARSFEDVCGIAVFEGKTQQCQQCACLLFL